MHRPSGFHKIIQWDQSGYKVCTDKMRAKPQIEFMDPAEVVGNTFGQVCSYAPLVRHLSMAAVDLHDPQKCRAKDWVGFTKSYCGTHQDKACTHTTLESSHIMSSSTQQRWYGSTFCQVCLCAPLVRHLSMAAVDLHDPQVIN